MASQIDSLTGLAVTLTGNQRQMSRSAAAATTCRELLVFIRLPSKRQPKALIRYLLVDRIQEECNRSLPIKENSSLKCSHISIGPKANGPRANFIT